MVTLPLSEYRYRARKDSSASAIWLAGEISKNINKEERMKNKKYRSLKMFLSDIILKKYCKN